MKLAKITTKKLEKTLAILIKKCYNKNVPSESIISTLKNDKKF